MAVVDAMVARHFTDGEIWQTLEGSALFRRRVEKKGDRHTRQLYATEVAKARSLVAPFERDPAERASRKTSLNMDARVEELPEIVVTNRRLRDLAADAWHALEAQNDPPRLFQHGGGICDIDFDDHRRPLIRHFDSRLLKGRLDRIADWVKETRSGPVPARPPTDVVEDMLAGSKPLPIIRGIIGTPVYSEGAVIVTIPGYQPETQLYYFPEGQPVPTVPSRPTPADVTAARRLIEFEWLGEFPFVDQASLANTVAAVVTPLVREMVSGSTPLFIFDAPAPGTGKGLVTETLATVVCGSGPGVMNDTRNEDEMRKRVTSLLREGSAVAVVDNVKREIDSATLAALLTTPVWVDRLLGNNQILRLPNRALWVVTGNNIKLSNEIARRSVWSRLDARVDRPWEREGFRHPQLRAWVEERRHEILWALLTLVQNWIAKGRPHWRGKVLGSFESWSMVVGGVLEAAGFEGFMANREELYRRTDTETEEWRAFVEAWWEQHCDDPVKTAELVPLIQQKGLLPTQFRTVKDGASERSFGTRLGTALAEHRDRRYGRYFLRGLGIDAHTKVAMYRLELAADPAGPVGFTAQGTAQVPQESRPSPDSVAGPAGRAGPDLTAKGILQVDPGDHSSREGAIKVPQVPQLPQTDSKSARKPAGPVNDEAPEVPPEVPQAGGRFGSTCGCGASVVKYDEEGVGYCREHWFRRPGEEEAGGTKPAEEQQAWLEEISG
jgi:putative DNA primase/helicase